MTSFPYVHDPLTKSIFVTLRATLQIEKIPGNHFLFVHVHSTLHRKVGSSMGEYKVVCSYENKIRVCTIMCKNCTVLGCRVKSAKRCRKGSIHVAQQGMMASNNNNMRNDILLYFNV